MRRPFPRGPAVMGIVNLTPDSFSDGGRFEDPEAAVAHALRLVDEGADLLDLGAESTRPGAGPVSPEDERRRLLPVLERLRQRCEIPLSIDTRNASTAQAALELGADLINDVSALRHDAALAGVVAAAGAGLILMHSRQTPRDMQQAPHYDDVVAEVAEELARARDLAARAGCALERIVLDPGLGFAKTADHNLELLRRLPELARRLDEPPLLVGASRKALVGTLLSRAGVPRPVEERAAGSVGLALAALAAGAHAVRVHDVRATVDAWTSFRAVTRPGSAAAVAPADRAAASPGRRAATAAGGSAG